MINRDCISTEGWPKANTRKTTARIKIKINSNSYKLTCVHSRNSLLLAIMSVQQQQVVFLKTRSGWTYSQNVHKIKHKCSISQLFWHLKNTLGHFSILSFSTLNNYSVHRTSIVLNYCYNLDFIAHFPGFTLNLLINVPNILINFFNLSTKTIYFCVFMQLRFGKLNCYKISFP